MIIIFIGFIVGLILSGMIYAVAGLIRHAWKVRGWKREGAWEKFAF
jgi:hypothetical protein